MGASLVERMVLAMAELTADSKVDSMAVKTDGSQVVAKVVARAVVKAEPMGASLVGRMVVAMAELTAALKAEWMAVQTDGSPVVAKVVVRAVL